MDNIRLINIPKFKNGNVVMLTQEAFQNLTNYVNEQCALINAQTVQIHNLNTKLSKLEQAFKDHMRDTQDKLSVIATALERTLQDD